MKRSVIRSAQYVAMGVLLVGTLVSTAEAWNRKFYLTKDTFDGSHALTACSKGYHMASLWEILNVATLIYNTKLGVALDDAGSGPPSDSFGWIRTGNFSDGNPQAGIGNCNTWTSNSGGDNGTYAFLPHFAGPSSTNISPWASDTDRCSTSDRVWCVSGQ